MVFYVMIIFGLTSIPGSSFSRLTFLALHDKIVHFSEYLILGFLFYNALKPEYQNTKGLFITFVFLIIIPVIDENIQRLIPGRFPDYMDGVADICGGICGAFIRSRK